MKYMGAVQFRDPIMSAKRRRSGLSGLGANTSGDATAGAATGTAIGVGAAALTGAAAGSVVPVLGTAIGAVIGLAVGLLGGGGNKEAGGVNNPVFVATTNKWYNWFLGRPADPAGALWWPGQMQANGLPNAWQNFSTSKEPVAAGVAAKAAQYQQLGYGNPTDPPPPGTNPLIAPPLTMTYQQYITQPGMSAAMSSASPLSAIASLFSASATPQSFASMTPAQQAAANAAAAPLSASLLPAGLSLTTLSIVGGGLLVGMLLTKKRSPSRRRR